jgi:arylformamidase
VSESGHRDTSRSPFIDISVPLRQDTPEWPGDTPFTCGWTWEIAKGASVNVSVLSGSPHVGTHADAPLHIQDGWPGVSDLPLDPFIGPAVVVDVRGLASPLELPAFGSIVGDAPVTRLLLKTGASIAGGRFPDRWPVLSTACLGALLAGGLRLLGVDAPSVDEREARALPVHRALFSSGACILENLDLRAVGAGPYILYAFPIKVDGGDGAPVRAILQRPSST